MSKAKVAIVGVEANSPRRSRAEALALARKRLAEMNEAEDAALTAAALADPDAQPVDHSALRRGRPPLTRPKEAVKLRIDGDVIDAFRSSGKGWQTRINDALRKAAGLS